MGSNIAYIAMIGAHLSSRGTNFNTVARHGPKSSKDLALAPLMSSTLLILLRDRLRRIIGVTEELFTGIWLMFSFEFGNQQSNCAFSLSDNLKGGSE